MLCCYMNQNQREVMYKLNIYTTHFLFYIHVALRLRIRILNPSKISTDARKISKTVISYQGREIGHLGNISSKMS